MTHSGHRVWLNDGGLRRSKQWLRRQQTDPFVRAATAGGLRARSAFKLRELDDKFKLLRPGLRVLDLGAAPGSWSQVAVERVRSTAADPLVVGIDLLPIDPLDGARFLRGDALDQSTVDALSTALGGRGADVLLSDMAPNASGHKSTDHLRQMELCFMALSLCEALLRQKTGSMIVKVFAGAEEAAFISAVRAAFASVKRVKPDASRKESREFFLVAQGYHGRGPSPADEES